MSIGNYLNENCSNCSISSKELRKLFHFSKSEVKGSPKQETIAVCENCFPKVMNTGYWKASVQSKTPNL